MVDSLPFKVVQSEELLVWRAETFWRKEPETILWIKNYLKIGNAPSISHFIDVGANVGMYSLFAATLNESIKIISVEPVVNNLEFLYQNILLNGFESQIEVEPSPLWSEEGFAIIQNEDFRPGASGAQVKKSKKVSSNTVHTLSGDYLFQKHSISSALLKIDVDGSELEILRGFEKSFRLKKIVSVLVECTQSKINQITTFLESYGFVELTDYENVPGHSRLRRALKQNAEMNKIFRLK
jgi:FkbM family methyltransferase